MVVRFSLICCVTLFVVCDLRCWFAFVVWVVHRRCFVVRC